MDGSFTLQRGKRMREEASSHQPSLSIVVGKPRSAKMGTSAGASFSAATSSTTTKQSQSSVIVGTSTSLVKAYVRPATAPNLQQVRPLAILQRAFEHALFAAAAPTQAAVAASTAAPTSSSGLLSITPTSQLEVLADQLKSIRQDLTIQTLETDFTSLVYETHARLSIALNHTTDFGQCLNFVKKLHGRGMSGASLHHIFDHPQCATLPSAVRPPKDCSPMLEFSAFRIVYSGLTTAATVAARGVGGVGPSSVAGSNGADESGVANEIMWSEKHCHRSAEGCVDKHLFWAHPTMDFAVRSVECKDNAVPFMHLVRNAPSYCLRQLLLLFVPRLRLEWLRCVAESFVDFLPASALMAYLGYRSVEEVGQALGPLLGNKFGDGFRGRECKAVLLGQIELLTRDKR